MVLLQSLDALTQWQASMGWHEKVTGFVPTMGALHEGHASLIRLAKSQSELVVVSILVNPTQFNDAQDFETYPRTLEGDMDKAQEAGADAVFAPSAEALYGGKPQATAVHWGPLTHAYEGARRPGHFDGVVAVVDLLFQAVHPTLAVFGEKDLQQVGVIEKLAKDRHPGLKVVVAPLVREPSGLAMSSRNARLSTQGGSSALALHQALLAVQRGAMDGDVDRAVRAQREALRANPAVTLEYLDVLDALTFVPWSGGGQEARPYVVVAAEVEGVRLIDNMPLKA
jgi:pantoate--beta-alanine ligase